MTGFTQHQQLPVWINFIRVAVRLTWIYVMTCDARLYRLRPFANRVLRLGTVQNSCVFSVSACVSTSIHIGGGVIRSTNFCSLGGRSWRRSKKSRGGRKQYPRVPCSIWGTKGHWDQRQDYYYKKLEETCSHARVADYSFTSTTSHANAIEYSIGCICIP